MPQRFSSQLVADDDSPRDRGRFTIVAPKIDDTAVTGARYGLQDESAKINLATILNLRSIQRSPAMADDSAADNTNAHAILMGLPGMTDDTADAILDWIDADDTPRDQGAESDFYGSLDNGYTPRDRPPVSIEELLLVRGVTPELLFGYDAVKMGYSSSDSVSAAISGVAHRRLDGPRLGRLPDAVECRVDPQRRRHAEDQSQPGGPADALHPVERRARAVVGRVHRRLPAGRRHRGWRRTPRHDQARAKASTPSAARWT